MAASRQVTRFGPFEKYIANGVKVGDTLYLSGQVSLDSDGNLVGADDLEAQVRQAYVNVREVLARLGASMDDIVDEMWLVTDMGRTMEHIDALFEVRATAYGGTADVAQTLVQVGALVMPELLIEIKCTARVGAA